MVRHFMCISFLYCLMFLQWIIAQTATLACWIRLFDKILLTNRRVNQFLSKYTKNILAQTVFSLSTSQV